MTILVEEQPPIVKRTRENTAPKCRNLRNEEPQMYISLIFGSDIIFGLILGANCNNS